LVRSHTVAGMAPLISALARGDLNPTPALRSSHGRHAHVGENTETTIDAAPSSMTHGPRPAGIRRRCSNRSHLLPQRPAPMPNDASVATSLTSTSKTKPPPDHFVSVIRASRASRLTQETPSHPPELGRCRHSTKRGWWGVNMVVGGAGRPRRGGQGGVIDGQSVYTPLRGDWKGMAA